MDRKNRENLEKKKKKQNLKKMWNYIKRSHIHVLGVPQKTRQRIEQTMCLKK